MAQGICFLREIVFRGDACFGGLFWPGGDIYLVAFAKICNIYCFLFSFSFLTYLFWRCSPMFAGVPVNLFSGYPFFPNELRLTSSSFVFG